MKISIITVCRNSVETIEGTIRSVLEQKGPFDLEYLVIDGKSTDATLSIVRKFDRIRLVSEGDCGIYDAMNKGIKLASGDIVGILNSDDVYAHSAVLEKVADMFTETGAKTVYGDLVYVKIDDLNKVIRYWKSGAYKHGLFKRGWMPPHPAFFARREVYEKYGMFNLDLRLAADYELMLRFLEVNKLTTAYLPEILVKMRMGGASNNSIGNLIRNYRENRLAWKLNGIKPSFYTLFWKRFQKISQFLHPFMPENKTGAR